MASPLPEHPVLRAIAEEIEVAGIAAEIIDRKWCSVYTSTEQARIMGLDPDARHAHYGESLIAFNDRVPQAWGVDRESRVKWVRTFLAEALHDVPLSDPDFHHVFGPLAERMLDLEPVTPQPARTVTFRMPSLVDAFSDGTVQLLYVRVHDSRGEFIGYTIFVKPEIPQRLVVRLARGDLGMFERMERVSNPAPRPAAILFADLQNSGELSRRLSSRSYFELIRDLTDAIDGAVIAHGGIIGKHAGDGASALFVAEASGEESVAARCAIDAARVIQARSAEMDAIVVNVGLHWGSRLMIGQVSTTGRLEVTALGDEMNEAARIQGAARGGAVLASKALVERLDVADADAAGIELDHLQYRTVSELVTDEKALRDAGGIAVTNLSVSEA